VTDEPVTLAGWSLGGMLAIQIASDSLLPLKQLVLIATTPRFTNADDWTFGLPAVQVHALKRNLKRHFEKTLAEFFRLTLAGETVPLERLKVIRNFAVINRPLPNEGTAVDLLDVLAGQDQREALASIGCPVLVIHGSDDQVSPCEAGRYIADTVEDGYLVEFHGVGHAPFWSKPEEFAGTLREYC
jgi:pimeloyl-[acyl-carrier protein] methyl ester esterase